MRTIDEPGRVCDMSDNSSFVVVHIFPFAFIEGEVPVFFIVVYFQVTDGERGCFQNIVAHTEEKLRGKCPFIQPNALIFQYILWIFLFIFSRCHSINHLEAFTEMLRILKSGLVCYLGEVVRPLSDQFRRFLQTYVFDELHR